MRQHLLAAVTAFIASAGYFLLLDFARPALENRQLLFVWWAILGIYAALVFVVGFGAWIKARPKFTASGLLLFSATLYLYDPTISPRLQSIGLGWLWVASLILAVTWLLTLISITRRGNQEKVRVGGEESR